MPKLYLLWLMLLIALTGAVAPLAARAQTPAWDWAVSPGAGYCRSTVIDAAGNAYVTGRFRGSATFGATTLTSVDTSDIYIAKISSTGAYQWAVRAGGVGADGGLRVALAANGQVLVGGYFYSATATFGSTVLTRQSAAGDVFVARLSPAGQWLGAVSNTTTTAADSLVMAFDSTGNLFVAGRFNRFTVIGTTNLGTVGGYDAFFAELSPAGQWRWASDLGSPADDEATGITVDGQGNMHVTGMFEGVFGPPSHQVTSAGLQDVFVATWGPGGLLRRVIRGGSNGVDTSTDLVADRQGNVYVAGAFAGTATDFGGTILPNASSPGLSDLYVARLDSGGAWRWAVAAGGAGAEKPLGLAVGRSGVVCVTGTFDSPAATFGATALAGTDDAYVAQITPAGTWDWAKRAGGPGRDVGQVLAIDDADNVVMAGEFAGTTMTCGATVLPGAGAGYTVFVSRLAEPNGLPDESPAARLKLYPNPAHSSVQLEGAAGAPIELVNALGQVVRTALPEPGTSSFDVSSLAPGLYVVRCGNLTRRLVVE